jgi:hypothetical protein
MIRAGGAGEMTDAQVEEGTAYNAGVISALEKEIIQPWEAERIGKLPQWARLLINKIIKRLANSRAEVARLRARPTEEEVAQVIFKYGNHNPMPIYEVARAVIALFPKVQP